MKKKAKKSPVKFETVLKKAIALDKVVQKQLTALEKAEQENLASAYRLRDERAKLKSSCVYDLSSDKLVPLRNVETLLYEVRRDALVKIRG